ncbi:uncharacterized protein LOC144160567, partial [Haemaphysalis longicornis]
TFELFGFCISALVTVQGIIDGNVYLVALTDAVYYLGGTILAALLLWSVHKQHRDALEWCICGAKAKVIANFFVSAFHVYLVSAEAREKDPKSSKRAFQLAEAAFRILHNTDGLSSLSPEKKVTGVVIRMIASAAIECFVIWRIQVYSDNMLGKNYIFVPR